jgi:hypothetical protein
MNELNEMDCTQLASVAAELALDVLTGRGRAEAIAHLEGCEACRRDVRQLTLTGEELLGLLPASEPPAGFEIRVLEQLGLPVPGRGIAGPPRIKALGARSRGDRKPWRPSGSNGLRSEGNAGSEEIFVVRGRARRRGPARGRGRAGEPLRAGRARKVLMAAATSLAVVAAGFCGWWIGATTSAAPGVAPAPLHSADLITADDKVVGAVFLYSSSPGWLYFSVDTDSSAGRVTCQVVGMDGQVRTIGSFRLAWGDGFWGIPDPDNIGLLRSARLVSPDGTVLATASFRGW